MAAVDSVVTDDSFEPALDLFRRLGLAVRMIMPADDPAVALLEGDGMTIRLIRGDLLPSRQGGRFIASHIRIPEAGPVRLVYEGQGGDFVLATGDCVLQPPGIRHRARELGGAGGRRGHLSGDARDLVRLQAVVADA